MESSRGERVVRALVVALTIVGAEVPCVASAQPVSAAAIVTPMVEAGRLPGAVVLVSGPEGGVAEEAVGLRTLRCGGRAMTGLQLGDPERAVTGLWQGASER